MQSVDHTLSLPLPAQGEDSSHSAPTPAWGPSHRTQSSMNFSSMGPFHIVQSFRNRLLQHKFPTQPQVLPANLLQRWLLFMGAPAPPHWPWCLQSSFSHIVSLLSLHCCLTAGFFPFLNMLSERTYQHHWWGQPLPAAGVSWSWLALVLLNMGETSSSFSQKPPLYLPSPPATKSLPWKPTQTYNSLFQPWVTGPSTIECPNPL